MEEGAAAIRHGNANHGLLLFISCRMMNEKSPQKMEAKTTKSEPWRNRPLGYPRLAERMGVKPETLIFRKFVALNARVLLYMQAELSMLEEQLQAQEEKDRTDAEGNRSRYASDFNYLLLSFKDGNTAQLDLVRTIQGKLEIYSEYC